ncbi:MAG: HNH endonuclease, partial [Pseudobdellovibrionaceae bacterium]
IANDLKSGNLNLTQVALAQVAIRQEEKARAQNHSPDQLHTQNHPNGLPHNHSTNKLHNHCLKISLEQKIDILQKMKSKNTYETQKILKEALPAFEVPKPKVVPAGEDKVHVSLQFSETDWEKVQCLLAHFSHTIPDQKIESLLLYWHSQVEKKKQTRYEKVPTETLSGNEIQSVTSNQKKTNMSRNKSEEMATDESDQKVKSPDISLPLRQGKQTPVKLKNDKSSIENHFKRRRSYIPIAVKVRVRAQAQDRCEFVSTAAGRRCASKHFLETEHRIPIAKGGTSDIQNLRLFCRSHNALAAKVAGISQWL